MNAASDEFAGFCPCLILAHTEPAYAAPVLRMFRRQGWDVYPARTGPEDMELRRPKTDSVG